LPDFIGIWYQIFCFCLIHAARYLDYVRCMVSVNGVLGYLLLKLPPYRHCYSRYDHNQNLVREDSLWSLRQKRTNE
jgi:hypothetical protein